MIVVQGIGKYFLSFCESILMIVVPKEGEMGEWIKRVSAGVAVLVIASIIGGMTGVVITNLGQDKDISMNSANLKEHKQEDDRKFDQLHEEIRDIRTEFGRKLDIIIQELRK